MNEKMKVFQKKQVKYLLCTYIRGIFPPSFKMYFQTIGQMEGKVREGKVSPVIVGNIFEKIRTYVHIHIYV